MPETSVTPAPRALIYIPGLGRDQLNSAAVIARSIACVANRELAGDIAVTEKSPPAPPGLKAVCTIVGGGDGETRLLDVFELDYRDRLKAMDRRNGLEAVPRGPLQAAVTAILVWGALLTALKPRNKSSRAKIQLTAGLSAAVLLVAWAAYLIVTAIASLIVNATGSTLTGTWALLLTPEPSVVLFGGVVTGAAYIALRDGFLRAANRVAELIDYHTRPDRAKTLADYVGTGIDALRDQDPERELHLLAYSFGATVLLDTILPLDGKVTARPGSFVHSIASLTTVGCPTDLLQLYRPHYYDNRQALIRPDQHPPPRWNNIFIASDIFGSNFFVAQEPAGGDIDQRAAGADFRRSGTGNQPEKAAVELSLRERRGLKKAEGSTSDEKEGSTRGPCDLELESYRYLPQETLTRFGWLRQTALKQHARYWEENGGCWSFVLHEWLPVVDYTDRTPNAH